MTGPGWQHPGLFLCFKALKAGGGLAPSEYGVVFILGTNVCIVGPMGEYFPCAFFSIIERGTDGIGQEVHMFIQRPVAALRDCAKTSDEQRPKFTHLSYPATAP